MQTQRNYICFIYLIFFVVVRFFLKIKYKNFFFSSGKFSHNYLLKGLSNQTQEWFKSNRERHIHEQVMRLIINFGMKFKNIFQKYSCKIESSSISIIFRYLLNKSQQFFLSFILLKLKETSSRDQERKLKKIRKLRSVISSDLFVFSESSRFYRVCVCTFFVD